MNAMIKCLPEEIQGKFRSGVAIPSLQQCVEELILNSIDAEATCVSVRIDMEAFKVQVIDNGAGMSAEDMESVGNRYHTSKCSSVEDLEHLRYYGFRGEAVASIISLATLVEISSRVKSSAKTYVKIFKDGKCLDVFEAEIARPSAGTTFIIYNFFHNMPVRRKRMDAVLEGERIRHRVEAISLMHPSVSFTLKNDCTGAMMVQLSKARNIYHRFVQIHGLGRAQKLGEVSYTGGQFEVTGYIGREGHYNNSLQFLYVNDRLLLKTRIHKLLNFLLRRLRSSNQKNDSPEGQSAIRSPKHKRSQELHGVYIINIKCSYSEYDVCLEPAKTLIEFKDWAGVLLCIEEAVKVFLSRENLVAELSQDDLEYASPKLFGIAGTEQEGNSSSQGIQFISTFDCTIGMKLASESVHRKHKDDNVLENSVGQESVQIENKGDQEEQQGQKRIITNDLENTESCTKKECGDESQCDSFTLKAEFESVSDNTFTEEEEPTSSNSGEDSQIVVYMPDSDGQLRNKQLELSKEGEKRINTITSTSTVTLQDSITQEIQPDLNMTESFLHEHTVINRKISLSDPYIHESLQTDLSQSHRPTFQQQNLVPKSEETSCMSKRKISLIESTHHNRSSHKVCKDIAPVIPAKISRVVSCENLILCKQSGSLDKFRRIYGKSAELKSSSLETHSTHSLNDDRLPQTGGFVSNPRNIVVSQKDEQKGNITETQISENAFRSPPTLSVFTKLKPISGQNKAKEKSLAAKLCHLKQRRTEFTKGELEHLPRAMSQDDACLKIPDNDIQDNKNNNEHPCDTALNAEQIPGCSTNLQVDEREEDTASGDWLHHYDTSLGKIVYVNKVTGLSQYENPTTKESQVCCTSDVTNMAVSVVSDSGECYHPHQQ